MENETTVATPSFTFDTKKMSEYRKAMLNPVMFRAGMAGKLPMGILAGLNVIVLDEKQCKVTVPYKYLNKNPFNTTYWAVLGMAAEMAPGALVMMYTYKSVPSVSTFVVGCEGKFIRRAIGLTTFVTSEGQIVADAVRKTIETGEAQEFVTTSIGYDEQGEVVSEFTFTWGVKARKPKA